MKTVIWNDIDTEEQNAILQRPVYDASNDKLSTNVGDIISQVRNGGDDALLDLAKKFDGFAPDSLAVTAQDIDKAEKMLSDELKQAIQIAHKNITAFHTKQGFQPYSVETGTGIECKRIVRPLQTTGFYIPAGSAPLFSTVLMISIPAQIAGCPNRILCSPARKNKNTDTEQIGDIDPAILYAAKLCGITRIFRIGGAQAIAAMAYGTQTVPKVDKIFGPGNQYVTEAKKQVSSDPAGALLDMPAGPSEVCVIADETTDPVFAASDLLSQAEHDTQSQVVLITPSKNKAAQIMQAIDEQLQTLPRREIAKSAIKNSRIIIANDIPQAIKISNQYAPEHLILCFEDAEQYLNNITNAGSIFVGPWTPESAGDYASGTNHVLPTYGYARGISGLSVEAFQKTMSVQNISQQGLVQLGPSIIEMANAEGLDAHARAVSLRLASAKE